LIFVFEGPDLVSSLISSYYTIVYGLGGTFLRIDYLVVFLITLTLGSLTCFSLTSFTDLIALANSDFCLI